MLSLDRRSVSNTETEMTENTDHNKQAVITKTLLDDEARMTALPKHFGPLFSDYERAVYEFMEHFCPSYKGRYWKCFELSNGGFFMSLDNEKKLEIINSHNGFEGTMSSEAASIGVNLMVITNLSYLENLSAEIASRLAGLHGRLQAFAAQHEEAALIAGFTKRFDIRKSK